MKSEDSRTGCFSFDLYSRINGTKLQDRIHHWVSEEGFHEVLIISVNAASDREKKSDVLDNHQTCRQRSDSEHSGLEPLSSVPPAQD